MCTTGANTPYAMRKQTVFDVLDTLRQSKVARAANVLVRVDFNVPIQSGVITDDSRIRGALPTIQALLNESCNVILMSHMGRPKAVQNGPVDDPSVAQQRSELSLLSVSQHLAKLVRAPVRFVDDCLQATEAVSSLPSTGGVILLLENLRFYKQEEKNDTEFAAKLASYGDAFINDAFGTCHRAHASTAGIPRIMAQTRSPSLVGIGCLVASELSYLDFSSATKSGGEKIVAIIGGSKVSTKLPVIKGLLKTVDTLILGGGLAYTFLKAMGIDIGTSLVEESMIETAKTLMKEAQETGTKLVIPVDAVCASSFPKSALPVDQTTLFDMSSSEGGIRSGFMGLDVGPQSIALFRQHLVGATKVVFNGPMGVFEVPPFDSGTRSLIDILAEITKSGTITVVGGGDSVAALEQFGKMEVVSYVSTGGGATLELLAGDELPGVTAIPDMVVPSPSPTPGKRKRTVFHVLEHLSNVSQNQPVASNVLVRVDFNVPMQNGTITDDSRIRAAIPTIQAILAGASGLPCNAILMSHMGRPKLVPKGPADDAKVKEEHRELSLEPVARHLSALLDGAPVLFADDCLRADDTIAKLPSSGGGILLLENLRFYKDEEKNDTVFAQKLASYADAFINDAFGTCHRAHASTAGVPAVVASSKSPKLVGIGCLVASELKYLDFSSARGGESVAAIIGGSKVSTKLPVIKGLLKTVDTLILGGGLAYTFIKAMGVDIGNSLVEDSMVDTAKALMKEAEEAGKQLVLPVDAVCAAAFPKTPMSKDETVEFDLVGEGIAAGYMGLDIGPKSLARFKEALKGSTKIVFNGPMGVFEVSPFDEGTRGLVDLLEDLTHNQGVVTVVGGGDSVAALEQFGKFDAVSYVSTGGGATLELLAGDELPGVTAIPDL
jgi:phosphoglycerate kinase